MYKNMTLAALAALSNAKDVKIQYSPDVDLDEIRVDPMEYQMLFKWPYNDARCGATMITDQIALTAAHCVTRQEDGLNPGLQVQMSNGDKYGIKEFRVNECWDFRDTGDTFAADIAIMILDRPIPGAKKGVHYVDTWNGEENGDETGKTMTVAGWGNYGEVRHNRDRGDRHMTESDAIFHRGYNVINSVRDNQLFFTMDRPQNGGLDLEVAVYSGDSGTGGLIEDDKGEMRVAGITSHTEGVFWGAEHGYVRVGGYHWDWINDNVNSLGQRVPQRSQQCSGNQGGNDDGDSNRSDDESEGNRSEDEAEGSEEEDRSFECEDQCECDDEDMECWEMCKYCLVDYFGSDEEDNSGRDDESEGSQEEDEGRDDESEGSWEEDEGRDDRSEGSWDDESEGSWEEDESRGGRDCEDYCNCRRRDWECEEECYQCMEELFGSDDGSEGSWDDESEGSWEEDESRGGRGRGGGRRGGGRRNGGRRGGRN